MCFEAGTSFSSFGQMVPSRLGFVRHQAAGCPAPQVRQVREVQGLGLAACPARALMGGKAWQPRMMTISWLLAARL